MSMASYALVSGALFGIGLTVSRMIDPSRVIGFLDVAGVWDPTLAFVMAGALAVFIPAFAFIRKREKTLTGLPMDLPGTKDIDKPLVVGAVLFGIGWGLGGFCPGPGIAALAFGLTKPMVFVGAMIVGMVGFELFLKARDPAQ